VSWSESPLGVILADDNGRIQTGPFGSQLHESDYVEEGVPVIMPKDISDGDIDETTVARVAPRTAAKLTRHLLAARTIVLPRRGEITKRAFISDAQTGWLCGTGCLQIRLGGSKLIPEFLYYYLSSSYDARQEGHHHRRAERRWQNDFCS
jgi:type I restriction enzyme S subunit